MKANTQNKVYNILKIIISKCGTHHFQTVMNIYRQGNFLQYLYLTLKKTFRNNKESYMYFGLFVIASSVWIIFKGWTDYYLALCYLLVFASTFALIMNGYQLIFSRAIFVNDWLKGLLIWSLTVFFASLLLDVDTTLFIIRWTSLISLAIFVVITVLSLLKIF